MLDVRGHVDTVAVGPGEEKSTYLADRDAYLEGHIPVSWIGVCLSSLVVYLAGHIPAGLVRTWYMQAAQ